MTAHSCTKHDPGRDVCYIWHGCRCRPCTKAHTRTNEECRLRKLRGVTGFTSGIGTQRRIRALMAAGWGLRKIADHMGITKSAVGRLCRDPLPRVTILLAMRVRAAYDALWRGPDHCDRGVMRTRLYAARRGWAPPLAWDDDTIDDPDARPTGMRPIRSHEWGATREAVEDLLVMGETIPAIAARLSLTESAVEQAISRNLRAGKAA